MIVDGTRASALFCSRAALGIALATAIAGIAPASAQNACPQRGQLDTLYCDANGDLVADAPTDPAKWRDPVPSHSDHREAAVNEPSQSGDLPSSAKPV